MMTMTSITNQCLRSELEISERSRLRLQRREVLETFEPEELSLWTMLDMMTLLLIFFILLYESQLPILALPKEKSVINPAVQMEKIEQKIVSKKPENLNSGTDRLRVEKKLHQVMGGMELSGYTINVFENRIVLGIGEKISFKSGQASLLDHIKEPLRKIAIFINREYVYRIIVSGHTDDTPIHTNQFPSNWDLSVARALSVAKYLMANDVDPYRVSVEGFGQYDPISDNLDYAGRQANRRVEITLLKESLKSN